MQRDCCPLSLPLNSRMVQTVMSSPRVCSAIVKTYCKTQHLWQQKNYRLIHWIPWCHILMRTIGWLMARPSCGGLTGAPANTALRRTRSEQRRRTRKEGDPFIKAQSLAVNYPPDAEELPRFECYLDDIVCAFLEHHGAWGAAANPLALLHLIGRPHGSGDDECFPCNDLLLVISIFLAKAKPSESKVILSWQVNTRAFVSSESSYAALTTSQKRLWRGSWDAWTTQHSSSHCHDTIPAASIKPWAGRKRSARSFLMKTSFLT